MKIMTTKCKPSLLPSQQLSACHSTRSRRIAAYNTQITLVGGRYKSAILSLPLPLPSFPPQHWKLALETPPPGCKHPTPLGQL